MPLFPRSSPPPHPPPHGCGSGGGAEGEGEGGPHTEEGDEGVLPVEEGEAEDVGPEGGGGRATAPVVTELVAGCQWMDRPLGGARTRKAPKCK